MTAATPFEVLVGEAVRKRRLELGLSQDAVARAAGMYGFAATRSIIHAIERGTKKLDFPELVATLAAVGLTLQDLGSSPEVALGGEISTKLGALVSYATGKTRTLTVRKDSHTFTISRPKSDGAIGMLTSVSSYGASTAPLRAFTGSYSDAEANAASKLGVDIGLVLKAAEELWDRRLDDERDERVMAQAPGNARPRSVQALRGHVTRAMLNELRAALQPGA